MAAGLTQTVDNRGIVAISRYDFGQVTLPFANIIIHHARAGRGEPDGPAEPPQEPIDPDVDPALVQEVAKAQNTDPAQLHRHAIRSFRIRRILDAIAMEREPKEPSEEP